jgi:plastocyanin
MRRFVALMSVVTLALALAACGNDDKGATSADKGKEAQAFTIKVDGDTDAFNGEFATFTPSKFSVHPGDTVNFDLPRFSGVPHTVTLGTLVDKAITKLGELGPTASPAAQENSPEMLNLPDVFPHGAPQGPPKPNQSAAQPCFLGTGVPPLALGGGAPACPKTSQPAFDGTQAFFNSGMLANDGDAFKMKLSPDIKPGAYSMICLIHRGVMTATMTVAPKTDSVPTPDEVTAAGKKEIDDLVAKVKPAADAAQKATPDKAALGTGDPSVPSVVVADFGPKTISIPVGGSVTWNEFAFHTLTFNATDADVGVVSKQADGSWEFTQKAGPPAGFTVPPAAFIFPPPDDAKPLLVDLGKFAGDGFANTGITGSVPPQFIAFKVTFTKPGTYTVRCLVNPQIMGAYTFGSTFFSWPSPAWCSRPPPAGHLHRPRAGPRRHLRCTRRRPGQGR